MSNDRQTSENIHTIEQIKAAGNRIITTKGEAGLHTIRGNTHTLWNEVEHNLYTPYHSYVRDII